jgi:cation:H+ antiporter
LLVGSAVAIYFACEWFVHAVEWLGRRLKVGTVAVGTILAAFGTALPESVVTFVAVVFGTTAQQKDIGVGAAMGGPLALSTIAYAVVGVTLLGQRRHPRADEFGDVRKLRRDQVWFLAIFVVKVGLGPVSFTIKAWLGLASAKPESVPAPARRARPTTHRRRGGRGSGPGWRSPDTRLP